MDTKPLAQIFLLMLCISCSTRQRFSHSETKLPEQEFKPIEIITEEKIPDSLSQGELPWNAKAPLNIEEFRAAWVATVANINWPSIPGLSTVDQKKEAINLLDFLEEHNFNAVIFQVRPQADALYKSELEPWSYYLTGKQGKAPEPFYDPLEFWVEEAHKRGLELHVWLNPYRAHHTAGSEITDHSIVKTKPDLVVALENGMWWMDPALKGTQDHAKEVVLDIVKRYDIDGVHFDDYFYPYDSYNNGKDFPDERSWWEYQTGGGKLSKGDWRRKSVNDFIKGLYGEIKAEKPYVKFGLSPFGIWRPGYPESVKGYDQYDKLYADARLWLNEGWIDYFAPQLYWKIGQLGQSFPELLGWWKSENTQNRHLWPGINVGGNGDALHVQEVVNELMITRGMLPQSKGALHWSIAPLIQHDSLAAALKNGPYAKKALVPPSPWLDNTPPEPPSIDLQDEGQQITINWNKKESEILKNFVIYFKYEGGSWDYKILPAAHRGQKLQKELGEEHRKLQSIGVTAVDRSGNQSKFIEINIH